MDFPTFLSKANKHLEPPKHLIALDPGETTGYAIFVGSQLVDSGELKTDCMNHGAIILSELFAAHTNTDPIVVFEDYRIYSWKTDSHTWASLHTPRLIGMIHYLCYHHDFRYFLQIAQQPKNFCTDTRLKEWGWYSTGLRHARDAIRHGTYYMLFNHIPKKLPPYPHESKNLMVT